MATLTPDLTEFKMTQVLSEDTKSKSIAVCGTFDSSNSTKAVIIAEKQPIPSQTIHTLFPSLSHLKLGFQNDVYSQYKAQGPQDIGRLQLTAIYPATDKHIVKYSSQKMYIIKETPLQYRTITRPYIEEQSFSLQVRVIHCHLDCHTLHTCTCIYMPFYTTVTLHCSTCTF